ncbi:hypothetical protein [Citricoccus sp. GCM10030269]|uniref:hypothetical protein n=1 Tax=Citricoccus sp. GCM10030269 TaxID=3273388 RepID=UPI003622390B
MKTVHESMAVKADLVSPSEDGFVLLAAEIGPWLGPLPRRSSLRDTVLATVRTMARDLKELPEVNEVTVFRAVLRPPGEGSAVLRARGLPAARYDVVVLVRTTGVSAAREVQNRAEYHRIVEEIHRTSRSTYQLVARNDARIDDVDHGPDHPFLFNYFYADDADTVRQVWEYTAGWFQARTNLPNSVLMRPLEGESSSYGLVNHASWPHFRTFLPNLLFRPTFRSFVLANFKANGIAAQPIIYRRLSSTAVPLRRDEHAR